MKISFARPVLSFIYGNTRVDLRKPLNNTRCKKMRIKNIKYDIIIYLAFWALYAPLALLRWHSEEGSLFEISVILLLGLGVILTGLFLFGFAKRGRRMFRKEREQTVIEINDEPEPEPEDIKFHGTEAFRKLFSDGGVAK